MWNDELQAFTQAWERHAQNILKTMRSLPTGKYDFRPDAGGRSLGELAWHLAEVDAFTTRAVEAGRVDGSEKIPNLERPRAVEALAAGFERVHADALARIKSLKPADLDREAFFFGEHAMPIRQILWGALLEHSIHHLGQLVLLCRLAGGTPPGLYGPNREEMAAMRAAMSAKNPQG